MAKKRKTKRMFWLPGKKETLAVQKSGTRYDMTPQGWRRIR